MIHSFLSSLISFFPPQAFPSFSVRCHLLHWTKQELEQGLWWAALAYNSFLVMRYCLALVPRPVHSSQAALWCAAKRIQAQSRHLHPASAAGCCMSRLHPSPSLIQFLFPLQPSLPPLLILPVFLITSTQLHCYGATIHKVLDSFEVLTDFIHGLHATKNSHSSESSIGRQGSEFTGCRKWRYLCVSAQRCERAWKTKPATRHSFGMQLTQALFHKGALQLEKTVFKEAPLLGTAATF